MTYLTRSMAHQVRHRVTPTAARPSNGRPIAGRPTRRIFDSEQSYVGEVVRRERAKCTQVFLNDAAEARWAYKVLGHELQVVLERERYGWWDDESVPALVKIEIRSRMRVLYERYSKDW